MKQQWVCEVCDRGFDNEQECIEHEKTCTNIVKHVCTKCGTVETYDVNDAHAIVIEGRWHSINLGRLDYRSELDGYDISFKLCDKCLVQLVDNFEHRDLIYNSGSNYCYEVYDEEFDELK